MGRGKIHKYLVPVCESCHKSIEFIDGRKTSLGEANRLLDAIIAVGIERPRKCRLKPSPGFRRHSLVT